MYARLRVASSSPSVCLICAHLSRLGRSGSPGERYYTAQVALAARRPKSTNVEPGSSEQGSSATPSTSRSSSRKSSKTLPNSQKSDSAKAAQTKKKASIAARKALKEAVAAERRRKALSVLDKTSKFAAAITETLHDPTLADLEALRPRNPPIITLKYISLETSSRRLHHGSPSDTAVEQHSAAFQGLVDKLVQTFTRKQLVRLYKEGMRQGSSVQIKSSRPVATTKSHQDVAAGIVRWLWQWPTVMEVQERRAYLTERSERVFRIGISEFFLLLGPDGSSLLSLTESFKVVVKRVMRTEEAFSLVIEGTKYTLDRLADVLTERKKAILSEIVSVDAPNTFEPTSLEGTGSIRPDLLQRISKLSEALVEDTGNGMFRISAHHRRNIELATRLTTRVSKQATLPSPPLVTHLPTTRDTIPGMMFPHIYALFPLELSKTASLPWNWVPTSTLTSSSSAVSQNHAEHPATAVFSPGTHPLFRARKVSDWIGENVAGNVSHLRDGLGRLLTSNGQPHALRDILGLVSLDSPNTASGSGRQRSITASTGYVAFAAAIGVRNTFLPPLPGSWVFPNLLDWMRTDNGRMAFIPSLPRPLVRSTPSNQTVVNQLVYRSLVQDIPSTTTPPSEPPKTLKIDISFDPPTQDTHTSVSANRLRVLSGVESFVNVMLPDRPMDMQLSVFDSVAVPADVGLPEIRTYASNMARYFGFSGDSDGTSRPTPPLHLTYEGIDYVLDSNTSIRRSSQNIAEKGHPVDVMTEHATDLESDQQTITCQAICTEPDTRPVWQKFLGDCDRLTWLTREEGTISPKFSEREGTGDNQDKY